MRITLRAQPPFSLFSTVKSHGWYQIVPFEFDQDNVLLKYILRLHSGNVIEMKIREKETGVQVNIESSLDKEEKREVKQIVTWMLNLNQDLSDFYKLARKEPKLAQMKKKAQGRVLRSPTLFEDVVKTILTTNTLWAATKRMASNLVIQFGSPLSDDSSKQAFPTPEQLAKTNEKTLREQTRIGYRAPYVLKLAQDVASGELDLESLKSVDIPTVQLKKQLLALKGVGNYAAANLLMILGRYDFIPIDTWAMTVVSHEWHNGNKIKPEDVEDAFENWNEWKGLAYWFWDWEYLKQ
ncbi:MAG: DNA-3-methyladenine glycosylase family protein [Promethearchaeota archaeon]